MKARTQRTHFTGFSNRNISNPISSTTTDMYEKSFIKSRSLYYPVNNKINTTGHFNYSTTKSYYQKQSLSQANINFIYKDAQKGHHHQFESKRWTHNHNNSRNLQSFYQDHIHLAPLTLTFNHKLNSSLTQMKTEFNDKQINMHKLNELKRTFLVNNQKRRNLKAFFEKFTNHEGIVDKNGFRKLIKQYGYDASDTQVDLIFKLNQVHDKNPPTRTDNNHLNGLDLPQFINLMTKQNVYFNTLKFHHKNESPITHNYRFSPPDFEIFRNKFSKLKQAFKIYNNQSIDKEKFDKVMKKLDINDLIIKQSKRQEIFDNFAKQDGQLNVEQLLGAIASQEHERISYSGNQLKVTNQDSFEENVYVKQEFNFQKCQNKDPLLEILYPVNLKKASYVDFQRRVKSAQQICQKLKKINQSTNRNIITQLFQSNPTISKDNLYKRVQTLLQDQGYNFSKNQYKSFLSFIDFDSRNNISSQKLEDIVLKENDKQRVNRLDRRVRNDDRRENDEEKIVGNKAKEDEFVEKFRSKSSINWSSVKKNHIKEDNLPQFNIPTKFSAWPERLHQADLTLLQPKSHFGMGITEHQRFQKDEKHYLGQEDRLRKMKIYQNRMKKISQWSENNQRRVLEKANVQESKEAAKQYHLRLLKEQYQERCAN